MQNEDSNNFDLLGLIKRYDQGEITAGEVYNEVSKFCWRHPEESDKLLDRMSEHSSESIQRNAHEIREMIRREREQIKDIDHIRKTSPLQPGVILHLGSGYDAAYSQPWWLNGRQYYQATFIDFVHCGADKMPAAFVELEEEIDLTEGGGLRHKGRYALLKLLYVAHDWVESGSVGVHIVDALPADGEEFYASHPLLETAIETHASYRIMSDETEKPG